MKPCRTTILSLAFALLLTSAFKTPAAALKWLDGHHSACSSVCKAAGTTAVETGNLNGHPYAICRGNRQGGPDQDGRIGYNLWPKWLSDCYAGQGGREIPMSSYECLCH
jgi:hypothetical protein